MMIACLSVGLLFGGPAPDQPRPETADQVLQRVRQATQFAAVRIPETGLQVLARGEFAGMPARYDTVFNRDGHFRQSVTSRIETGMGFDGVRVWTRDIGGEVRVQELTDRKRTLLTGALITGMWLDPASGMSYTLPADAWNDGACTLLVAHAPTGLEGKLRIDAATWMPLDCTVTIDGRPQTIAWSDAIEFQGMRFPKRIQTTQAGSTAERYEIESIQPAPQFVRNPYEALDSTPDDTEFDNALPADLEVKRAKSGHLLVKPKVNGQDVGWFIFDSGAGSNVLANSVIQKLELKRFGELPAVGVGGAVRTSFSRPESISLGRATFKNPLVVGLDLEFLNMHMGVPIGGIIGYGSFHRCIVEADMDKAAVALFDPKHYDQSRVGDRWQRLYQIARVSCIDAEFEGHRGIFRLDTGAGGSTVVLHAPVVRKFKLLDNRETTEAKEGGVGGMVPVRRGKLQYFEIAGHRFENVVATFAQEGKGAYASGETMGNIGGELVKPFRMVFDYRNRRIAFVKRDAG